MSYKSKTVYTVFGAKFIKGSSIHFLYINAKSVTTKENHFITQCVEGSYVDLSNKFNDVDHQFDNKDCAYDYWVEIYGHNVDDFFDDLDKSDDDYRKYIASQII